MSKKDYLSRKTKRTVFLWAAVVLFVSYTPRFLQWISPKERLEVSPIDKEINQELRTKTEKLTTYKSEKKKKYSRPPRKFNPNTYSASDWQALGLSIKQAHVIVKFSNGGLKSNDELQKIYVLPQELFELIKDSTFYPKREFDQAKARMDMEKVDKRTEKLDLNTANLEELISLPGIGEYFAKQILERRKSLGGFYSLEQLTEIKYMDKEKIALFSNFVLVDLTKISPINLNEATYQQLKSHPYISSNLANNLVKMREQKSGFYRIDEILESAIIDSELFQKIKPYISL